MATLVSTRRDRTAIRVALRRHVVLLLAVAAVAARLPFLAQPPGKDEAGYLMIGQQWQAGGSSLYGNYWVDRPPLLITIFRFAAIQGGLVPLRLVGCLAVALVVLGSARVARRITGDRAAPWAALAAAALCVSPLLGSLAVNGELLSAPLVIGGIAAVLAALSPQRMGRAFIWAALAGAATVAAVMVKQNIADVGVFAGVAFVLSWRRGEIPGERMRGLVFGYVVGAALCLGGIALWTVLHGTSLSGVFDAMYPFRIEAGRVIAASGRQSATARLWLLLGSWLLSGGAVIMAVITWALVSRRLHGAAAWALVATLVFDVVSILLGGGYWPHYQIQLVGPISVAAGVLVAGRQPGTRSVLAAVTVVAAVAWGVLVSGAGTSEGSAVGHAVAGSASPRDTIITIYGHADVTQSSGLSSPYPYLWSLPTEILDPQQHTLDAVLRGRSAPTWFVTWSRVESSGMESTTTSQLIARDYHAVANLMGHTVYLRNGVVRTTPSLARAGQSSTSPARRQARLLGGRRS
ncbi:MAG: hypothetical protein ABI873_02515 [Marmoricola sp.]